MKYEEAIKLEPGTPIFIRSKVVAVDVTGDIVYETHAHNQEYEVMNARTDCRYVDIQTSEQKLDTHRLLKAGDKVRVVERYGRCYGEFGEYLRDKVCIVAEDENEKYNICIIHNGLSYQMDPAYIELVTPVEELEPYCIEECGSTYEVWNKRDDRAIVAMFFKSQYSSNQARELAEAECKRLNAEWRNKQKL